MTPEIDMQLNTLLTGMGNPEYILMGISYSLEKETTLFTYQIEER